MIVGTRRSFFHLNNVVLGIVILLALIFILLIVVLIFLIIATW